MFAFSQVVIVCIYMSGCVTVEKKDKQSKPRKLRIDKEGVDRIVKTVRVMNG